MSRRITNRIAALDNDYSRALHYQERAQVSYDFYVKRYGDRDGDQVALMKRLRVTTARSYIATADRLIDLIKEQRRDTVRLRGILKNDLASLKSYMESHPVDDSELDQQLQTHRLPLPEVNVAPGRRVTRSVTRPYVAQRRAQVIAAEQTIAAQPPSTSPSQPQPTTLSLEGETIDEKDELPSPPALDPIAIAASLPQDCPLCLEQIAGNRMIYPCDCQHGLCRGCFSRCFAICKRDRREMTCGVCRHVINRVYRFVKEDNKRGRLAFFNVRYNAARR